MIIVKHLVCLREEKGFVLVITLLIMLIMTLMGLGMLYRTTIQIRSVTSLRKANTSSLSAESGIFGVTGWMLLHKRTDIPSEIREKSDLFETDIVILDSDTVLELPGYSTKWRGMIVKIDSHSPNKTNAVSTIESTTFIPVAPAGYGNEPK